MPAISEVTLAADSHLHDRPIFDSYDSGEEFSFYHWIEVCELVDECDEPATEEMLPRTRKIDETLIATMSKMGPSPTPRAAAMA